MAVTAIVPLINNWSDATTMEVLHTLSQHTQPVHTIAFSPDDQVLVSCSSDMSAVVWDVASGAMKAVLSGHAGPVISIAFGRLRSCNNEISCSFLTVHAQLPMGASLPRGRRTAQCGSGRRSPTPFGAASVT